MARNDDRLSKNEFIELIPHLTIDDLLSIAFKVDKDQWTPFIHVKDESRKLYRCGVCDVVQCGVKNLFAHVEGKKHKQKMQTVQQLYHPQYTHPKIELKRSGNLVNKNVGRQIQPGKTGNKTAEKQKIAVETTLKSTMSSTTDHNNKTPVVEIQTNKEVEKITTSEIVMNISSSDSEENIKKESREETSDEEMEKSESITHQKGEECLENSVDDTKSDDVIDIESKEENRHDTTMEEDDIIIENSNMENESNSNPKLEGQSITSVDKTSTTNTEKLPEKETLQDTESAIIVIDDDDTPTDTEEQPPLKKSKTVINPVAVCRQLRVSENVTTSKEQRVTENVTTTKVPRVTENVTTSKVPRVTENVTTSKEQRVKKNVSTSKQVEKSVEKPNYRTNVIVIPTSMKNKTSQPKFSYKTIDSNPNDDIIGLLGVEYVVKISKHRGDTQPRYECGLCELILVGNTMQHHLVGYSHRLKFCERHFPTAIRQYRQYMNAVPEHEIFKVMTPVLAKLAVAIEKHHGRELPYECLERDYNINRREILTKVYSCRHAAEELGPAFTHVLDSKEIDEIIASRHTYKPVTVTSDIIFDSRPNSISNRKNNPPEYTPQRIIRPMVHSAVPNNQYIPSQFRMNHPPRVVSEQLDNETHKQMVEDFLRSTKRSRQNTRYRPRSRSRSPLRNKRKSLSPLRQNDIWQAYRHLVDQKILELDEIFKIYRKDPEMHPSYNNEWEMFWKRRKEELIASGLDHRTYNYQPEWVRFFNIRIEELYNQSVENVKVDARKRLCLPMTNDKLYDPKYHVHVNEQLSDPKYHVHVDEQLADPKYHVHVNDLLSDPTYHVHVNEQLSDPKYPVHVNEHLSDPKYDVHVNDDPTYLVYEKAQWPDLKYHVHVNEQIRTNISSSQREEAPKQKEPDYKGQTKPEVVSVLRLLTALEEYLGSIGPKIIEILSKALQVEKTHPDKLNSLILTSDVCSLLEIAMEKFKGFLMVGIVEGPKERVLKKAIEDVKSLLCHAEKTKEISINKNTQHHSQNISDIITPSREQISLAPSTSKAASSQIFGSKEKANVRPTNSKNQADNSSSQGDKAELSSKLAALLAEHGKTNVDHEQLKKILAVYLTLENKKRQASLEANAGVAPTGSESQRALGNTLSNLINSAGNNSSNLFEDNVTGININNQRNLSNSRYTNSNMWREYPQNNSNTRSNLRENNGRLSDNFMNAASNSLQSNFDTGSVSNITGNSSNTPSRSYAFDNGNNNYNNNSIHQTAESIFAMGNQQQFGNRQQSANKHFENRQHYANQQFESRQQNTNQQYGNSHPNPNQQFGNRRQIGNQPGINWNYNSTESSRSGTNLRQQDDRNDSGRSFWNGVNNWRKQK